MSGIFLEPESTFSVTVKNTGGGTFELTEGGEIKLRTCIGREYAEAQAQIRSRDVVAQFDSFPKFVLSGIEKADFKRLHPNAAALMMLEVLKRSHLQEEASGN